MSKHTDAQYEPTDDQKKRIAFHRSVVDNADALKADSQNDTELDESEVLFVMGLFGKTNVRLMRQLKVSRGEDVSVLNEAIRRFENV